jgi:hypothetical protein
MGLFRVGIELESLQLLRVHSLEGLNLKVDPVRRILVPAGPVITAPARFAPV